MNAGTYLLGGWALFVAVAAFLICADSSLIAIYFPQSVHSSVGALIMAVLVAALSMPVGYVVNQVWYAIYSLTMDVHVGIFRSNSQLKKALRKRLGSWSEGILNELVLAVYHRRSFGDSNLTEFLSWHRNRLNHLHSIGSIMTGLVIGFFISVAMIAYSKGIDALVPALIVLLPAIGVLVSVLLLLGLNAYRAFLLITLYNRAFMAARGDHYFQSRTSKLRYLFRAAPKPAVEVSRTPEHST